MVPVRAAVSTLLRKIFYSLNCIAIFAPPLISTRRYEDFYYLIKALIIFIILIPWFDPPPTSVRPTTIYYILVRLFETSQMTTYTWFQHHVTVVVL